VDLFLRRVEGTLGEGVFGRLPTLFWLDDSDGALFAAGLVGTALSAAALVGVTNAGVQLVLWALYVSIVNVGQDWDGYGWETWLPWFCASAKRGRAGPADAAAPVSASSAF